MADDIKVGLNVKFKKDKSKDLSFNARILKEQTKEAEKNTNNMAKYIAKAFNKGQIIGWATIIKDTTEELIRISKKQTEYIENLNMMQVAFGDSADSATKYIQSITNATGFDASGLTRQLGVFRQISDAMNYTSKTANLLSTNLSKMSLDVSSLFNVDIERAGRALESAITGNIQSIRRLTGADITMANLQQEAYRLGIEKTTREMTRAEKTILIYLTLERQLSNANGDLARTINSVANQTKSFKEQIVTLGRNIGGFVIPVLKTLLPILNGILMTINTIMELILNFFGIDAYSLSKEFGIASSGFEGLEEDLLGVESASQKAKKSLRGFDKLNNITTPTSSGSSAGSGIGSVDTKLLDALKEYNIHLDEMKNKATKIKEEILYWLGFSKKVNGEWKWSATDLLSRMIKGWSKLNALGKIFTALGIAIAIKKIFDIIKKVASLLMATKLLQTVKNLVIALGSSRYGLLTAINNLLNTATPFEKFLGVLAGIAIIADGAIKLGQGIKKWAEGTAELEDKLDVLWGFLEVMSGIALIVGVLTTNPYLVIASLVALGSAIAGQVLTDTLTGKDAMDKYRISIDELKDSTQDYLKEIDASEGRAETLVNELKKLYDENGNLIGSYDEANQKVSTLNDLLGTEYKVMEDGTIIIDGQASSIDDLKKNIEKYCEALRIQTKLEAYKEQYKEWIIKQDKAQKEYDETLQSIIKDEENYNTTTEEGVIDWLAHNKEKMDKLKELDDIIANNQNKLDSYEKASYEVTQGNYDNATSYIDQMFKTVESESNKSINDIIQQSDKVPTKIKENINKIKGQNVEIKIQFEIDQKSLDIAKEKAKNQVKSGGLLGYQINMGMSNQFADGGFVNSGDIFIANENNKPEYVGSFGHQTAVANTDQIVEGITVGVARAMKAVGNNNTKVVIEAQGDTNGLLDFITFEQKKKERQYGL